MGSKTMSVSVGDEKKNRDWAVRSSRNLHRSIKYLYQTFIRAVNPLQRYVFYDFPGNPWWNNHLSIAFPSYLQGRKKTLELDHLRFGMNFDWTIWWICIVSRALEVLVFDFFSSPTETLAYSSHWDLLRWKKNTLRSAALVQGSQTGLAQLPSPRNECLVKLNFEIRKNFKILRQMCWFSARICMIFLVGPAQC